MTLANARHALTGFAKSPAPWFLLIAAGFAWMLITAVGSAGAVVWPALGFFTLGTVFGLSVSEVEIRPASDTN